MGFGGTAGAASPPRSQPAAAPSPTPVVEQQPAEAAEPEESMEELLMRAQKEHDAAKVAEAVCYQGSQGLIEVISRGVRAQALEFVYHLFLSSLQLAALKDEVEMLKDVSGGAFGAYHCWLQMAQRGRPTSTNCLEGVSGCVAACSGRC